MAPSNSFSPHEKHQYAPLKPSPLNPNTYLDNIHPHSPHQGSRPLTSSSTKPNLHPQPHGQHPRLPRIPANLNQASPTERLLRQKAAAAWRSETLRHHVLSQSSPAHLPTQTAAKLDINYPQSTASIPDSFNKGDAKDENERSGCWWRRWPTDTASNPAADTTTTTTTTTTPKSDRAICLVSIAKRVAATTAEPNSAAAGEDGEADQRRASDRFLRPLPFFFFPAVEEGRTTSRVEAALPLHRCGSDREGDLVECWSKGGDVAECERGGVALRRALLVVAVFLGFGLIHGLLSALGSVGAGG
ncbi:hypothetical protein VTI74DRAFT_6466 [Chaetomium olivicolor]